MTGFSNSLRTAHVVALFGPDAPCSSPTRVTVNQAQPLVGHGHGVTLLARGIVSLPSAQIARTRDVGQAKINALSKVLFCQLDRFQTRCLSTPTIRAVGPTSPEASRLRELLLGHREIALQSLRKGVAPSEQKHARCHVSP